VIQHHWATTESWKNVLGDLESPGFFCKQEWEPCKPTFLQMKMSWFLTTGKHWFNSLANSRARNVHEISGYKKVAFNLQH